MYWEKDKIKTLTFTLQMKTKIENVNYFLF